MKVFDSENATVKRIWNNCQHCKIRRPDPVIPVIGHLSRCRFEKTVKPLMERETDSFGSLKVFIKSERDIWRNF